MAFVDFSITGDGVHDMGGNVFVSDIIGLITASSADVNVIDPASPSAISRFGFFMLGTFNAFGGGGIYYQAPIWIACVRFAWDFALASNETNVQYIRWHLFPACTADVRVYY